MTAADAGDAPLVILPGLLCDSQMFGHQIAAFGASCIDGHYGGADRLAAMAAYALERMPPRAALLGHSMGARVALEVWRQAPERVTRLALADTGLHPRRPGEAERRHALLDHGRRHGMAALVERWLPPMVAPAGRADAALMAGLAAMSTAAGLDVAAAQIAALLDRPDAEPALRTVDRPVFAIVGEQDEWSPVAQHEAIVAAAPLARLRVIAGAGHMAPAEAPAAFADALRDWLAWRP